MQRKDADMVAKLQGGEFASERKTRLATQVYTFKYVSCLHHHAWHGLLGGRWTWCPPTQVPSGAALGSQKALQWFGGSKASSRFCMQNGLGEDLYKGPRTYR